MKTVIEINGREMQVDEQISNHIDSLRTELQQVKEERDKLKKEKFDKIRPSYDPPCY